MEPPLSLGMFFSTLVAYSPRQNMGVRGRLPCITGSKYIAFPLLLWFISTTVQIHSRAEAKLGSWFKGLGGQNLVRFKALLLVANHLRVSFFMCDQPTLYNSKVSDHLLVPCGIIKASAFLLQTPSSQDLETMSLLQSSLTEISR